MKRIIVIAVLLVVALIVTASTAAPPPPQVTINQLRAKNQALRSDKADLQGQVAAQNLVIGDLQDQNQRLRNRIANWPDPLDVITARSPDGLWSAAVAIWQAFPRADGSQLCGYDKSSAPGDPLGLSVTVYAFERTAGC